MAPAALVHVGTQLEDTTWRLLDVIDSHGQQWELRFEDAKQYRRVAYHLQQVQNVHTVPTSDVLFWAEKRKSMQKNYFSREYVRRHFTLTQGKDGRIFVEQRKNETDSEANKVLELKPGWSGLTLPSEPREPPPATTSFANSFWPCSWDGPPLPELEGIGSLDGPDDDDGGEAIGDASNALWLRLTPRYVELLRPKRGRNSLEQITRLPSSQPIARLPYSQVTSCLRLGPATIQIALDRRAGVNDEKGCWFGSDEVELNMLAFNEAIRNTIIDAKCNDIPFEKWRRRRALLLEKLSASDTADLRNQWNRVRRTDVPTSNLVSRPGFAPCSKKITAAMSQARIRIKASRWSPWPASGGDGSAVLTLTYCPAAHMRELLAYRQESLPFMMAVHSVLVQSEISRFESVAEQSWRFASRVAEDSALRRAKGQRGMIHCA